MSTWSSATRDTIRSVSGSGVECGTPGMAPRLPLAGADELVVAVDDEVAALGEGDGEADGDGDATEDAAELTAEAIAADGPDEGTAAVPPTLAQEASARVATAARLALIKIGRALARPCDMSPFCQQE